MSANGQQATSGCILLPVRKCQMAYGIDPRPATVRVDQVLGPDSPNARLSSAMQV